MSVKQNTLAKEVTIKGIGLHTGKMATVTIKPAPVNTWYVFKRIDLEGQPTILADIENVSTTQRGTSLKQNGGEVHTIEHILAALYGMEVDNALIEIDGPEVPILDGSAKYFVEAIKEAGLKEQDAEREYFWLDENLKYENTERDAEFLAVPDDHYRITVMVDYHSPLLGTQHASMYHIGEFESEISSCRTFVFLRELVQLVNAGLIKGGDVDNAIVMVDTDISEADKQKLAETFNKPADMLKKTGIGILNNVELKFENEPARHKLLDIIGDLALVGKHIKAHILAARPGHQTNCEFARVLKVQMRKQKTRIRFDVNKEPVMRSDAIKNILPHRYPMLLVDSVLDLVPGKSIVAIKNVSGNEDFFNGHFPDEPVMPGVLIVEALAQAGGIMVLSDVDNPQDYATYFAKIDKVKFKQKVVPGDVLVLEVKMSSPIRRGIGILQAKAYVRNKLVTEGELVAQIAPKKR